MDSALDFGSRGCGFESHRDRFSISFPCSLLFSFWIAFALFQANKSYYMIEIDKNLIGAIKVLDGALHK